MRIAYPNDAWGFDAGRRLRRAFAVLVLVIVTGFCSARATFAGGSSDWRVTITLGDQHSGNASAHGIEAVLEGNPLLKVSGTQAAPVDRRASAQAAVRKNSAVGSQASATNAVADNYCINIVDAAKSAWLETTKQSLADAEKELEGRIVALEAKTAEHKLWLNKREEFALRAKDGLLKIYGRMRPDAAAAQLVALDDLTAAAILSRLDPKVASQIMTEMEAVRAARLSAAMVGAAGLSGLSTGGTVRGQKP